MARADVINAYRLFLGRVPEAERVVQNRAAAPLSKMLRGFAGSKEFSERVLRQLASGYPLPHFRIAAVPDSEIVAWAVETLPLGEPAKANIALAKTWRDILTQIVCDPEFPENFGPSFDEELLALLRRRQAAVPLEYKGREIVGGVEETAIFEIRGWAANLLNLEESLTLEFYLDNLFVGVVQTQHFRRDMQERLGGSGNFGFLFNVPAAHHPDLEVERLLTVRDSVSRMPIAPPIRVRLAPTEALDSLFRLHKEVESLATSIERLQAALPRVIADTEYPLAMYDAYRKAARNELMANRVSQAEEAASLAYQPTFSVVLSKEDVPSRMLSSINSLRRQTYRNWECMVCIPQLDDEVRSQFETLCANDGRIQVVDVSTEAKAWEKANAGLERASGDYILWLKEGDLLSADALFEMSRVLQERKPGLIYFDEDLFEGEGNTLRYLSPVLKTAPDRDFLLATDYIGNAFVCSRRIVKEAGGLRGEFGLACHYDLVFRLLEQLKPDELLHLERILYHRLAPSQLEEGAQMSARNADFIACGRAHLQRIGSAAEIEPHEDPYGIRRPSCRRVVWPLPEPPPLVSIIIPTRDRADLMGPCLQSVWDSQTHYPRPFELIIMDNESCEPETLQLFERAAREHGAKVIPFHSAFNWSAINNHAARRAEGDILLFLNNDTQVLTPDWIRELTSNAIRPDVGAVGARLLYEDGTIQHGGVVLGGRAVHEGGGQRPSDGGYLGRTALQRNVSAVTGACLATRKDIFLELGGFDEMNLKVAFNDIDYCLKIRAAGYSVIYTPFATLYHFESKSRGLDNDFEKRLRSQSEFRTMSARWGRAIECDPFYNPRFNRTGRPFTRLRSQQVISMPPELQNDEEELWKEE
ncbi:MAG: glycosyltransferase family 2 protein [Alphaproteobacteria bacterium]